MDKNPHISTIENTCACRILGQNRGHAREKYCVS